MTNEILHESYRGSRLSISIRNLRVQHDGAEVLLGIVIACGEHREQKSLVITTEQYCELKPTVGPLDEETYERLESAALLCAALRGGESLLSFGPNSVKMLTRKLMQRGFSKEVASAAAEKLCLSGLINERADLRREVEKGLRKLWGAKRISAHLWSRGFDQDVIRELPEILEEVDFPANCAAYIRKHYGGLPETPEEQKKMIAALCRYGYTLQEIKRAFALFEKK
ncbi:MAG: RecX family transcriptional regulator [Clostridia bacterium]|nr:RecX family transcriptional regulator [Clostridia bacterium]